MSNATDGKRTRPHRQRRDIAGHTRHLTCSCFRNRPFLRSERACTWFVEALADARERRRFHLLAWVAMPTHFHVLLVPRREDPTVGRILSSIKIPVTRRALRWVQEHAPAFVRHMTDAQPSGKTSLRFWQRNGGYDRNLWSPSHIWDTIRYIHLNPVEAGFVTRPHEWPWSSAAEYARRGSGPLSINWESIPQLPP